MTPITPEREVEIRDIASLSFPPSEWWTLHHDKYPDREIGIECVRELLAALDAARADAKAARGKAMRECVEIAKEEARSWAFDVESCGASACNGVARAIRALIAKEQSP